MADTYPALLYGGPMDGKVVSVAPGQKVVHAMEAKKPTRYEDAFLPPFAPPTIVDYQLYRVCDGCCASGLIGHWSKNAARVAYVGCIGPLDVEFFESPPWKQRVSDLVLSQDWEPEYRPSIVNDFDDWWEWLVYRRNLDPWRRKLQAEFGFYAPSEVKIPFRYYSSEE